jgi:hypothetical protein
MYRKDPVNFAAVKEKVKDADVIVLRADFLQVWKVKK